jgi:3-methyladenine DNA glycosylase AlkD
MTTILNEIRKELEANVDVKTQATGQNFFKEEIRQIGVKVPLVEKIGKNIFDSIPEKNKPLVFDLCERLWQTGYIEEAFIACQYSYYIRKEYEAGDIRTFENWIDRYVTNWATCDTLCNHTVGELVEKFPELISELKRWAKSENRWKKRAASVTLIIPARHGLFLSDIFEISDILLFDPDDLVQKGYGWMLKAASQAHQQEVYDYVVSKKSVMPRTSYRYALEKMPPELRQIAMEKN